MCCWRYFSYSVRIKCPRFASLTKQMSFRTASGVGEKVPCKFPKSGSFCRASDCRRQFIRIFFWFFLFDGRSARRASGSILFVWVHVLRVSGPPVKDWLWLIFNVAFLMVFSPLELFVLSPRVYCFVCYSISKPKLNNSNVRKHSKINL